jgi:uncharacterized protein (DUF4415 family)
MQNKRTTESLVTLVASLADGSFIVEHPDGRLERNRSETDWERLKAFSDEEIEQSIANDPDWKDFSAMDWSEADFVAPPKKKAISIRIDGDVLDYFKKQGAGYQKRINAVLRGYMNASRKGKKRA